MRFADLRIGLLTYFVGREHVYAVLAEPGSGRTSRHRLAPCRELIPEIDRLSPALAGSCPEGHAETLFQSFSTGWGRHLLPPASALAGLDVLVIMPHSVLHGLPLHAVCVEESAGPLALSCGVSYVSNGTVAMRCASRNPARRVEATGWEFPLGQGGAPASAPPAPERCFALASDVIHGNDEQYRHLAEAISAKFPDRMVHVGGRDGVKAHLYSTNPDPIEALCVVCHGFYSETSPESSGLLLQPAKGYTARQIPLPGIGWGRFADLPFDFFPPRVITHTDLPGDIITIEEFRVDCRTDAELVALVGCQTGAGTVVGGDEFMSIAMQWLNMGAVSVLSGTWAVDVRHAESWVPRFMECWLDRRQPKAIAFRQALREELARGDVPLSRWAVFTLLGDWV